MTTMAWPYPGDTPLERARRIAQAYRQHLRTAAPALCDQVDRMATEFGEGWVVPQAVVHEPGQAITTREAAALVHVTPDTIRQWACTPHPEQPGEPLLPRFKRRGRERTYLAEHVLAAAAAIRRTRGARPGA